MRVKGGKVEKIQVTIGVNDKASETTEVLAGLSAGDTLLVGAAQGITPGTPVRISAPVTSSTAAGSPERARGS
jgi:hypothetical protein